MTSASTSRTTRALLRRLHEVLAGHHVGPVATSVFDEMHLAQVMSICSLGYEWRVTERTLEQRVIDDSLVAGPREGQDGAGVNGGAAVQAGPRR